MFCEAHMARFALGVDIGDTRVSVTAAVADAVVLIGVAGIPE